MDEPSGFTSCLARWATTRPDRTAFTYLADGERVEGRLTFAALEQLVATCALDLQRAGARGERVLLLFPPGLNFVVAFLACLRAGAVAVPAYPPQGRRRDPRLLSIAADCRPAFALTVDDLRARLCDPAAVTPLPGLRWLTTPPLDAPGGAVEAVGDFKDPALEEGDLAFLQYTSGSTAAPKGVMVTHGNLRANEAMIQGAFAQDANSRVVSWLPMYHDMGLIGTVLQPLFCGGRSVLMSPMAFLRRPMRWLRAISAHAADTSGGPNFAYDLCVKRFREDECADLDLSSWRVAFNGAEPVRARTLDAFAERFAPYGFDRRAFLPCYGLAEATLLVSGQSRPRPPRRSVVREEELERHRAAAAEDGRELVASGPVAEGVRLAVVRPEDGVRLPERAVGELWVAGDGVAAGYWRRGEESERTFAARTAAGDGPFLRTGDLGFVADGEVYVTGRLKDLIILRGRNLYPQDLELTAELAHPELRPGATAAFPVTVDGEERVVLVAEKEPRGSTDATEVLLAVRRALSEEHEVQPHDLVLARAGQVPLTSSGKVRRRACRAAYLGGRLEEWARLGATAEAMDQAGAASSPLAPTALADGTPVARRAALATVIARRAGELVAGGRAVDPDLPLTTLGLDSLAAVELKHRCEADLAVAGLFPSEAAAGGGQVPLEEILRGTSASELAATVLAGLAAASPAGSDEGAVEPAVAAASGNVADTGDLPLSEGQRALWFLERLGTGGAYHLSAAALTRSPLDLAALEQAFRALSLRHPALRTTFRSRSGEPYRVVGDRPAVDFAAAEPPASADEDLEVLLRRVSAEAHRPFDLATGPLLRVRVWPVAAGGHLLLLAVHHLVADFASLALAVRELGSLYAAARLGERPVLPPADEAVAGFAAAEADFLAGPAGESAWAYWQLRLTPLPPPLDLPTDRPRPAVRGFRGERRAWHLGAGPAQRLRAWASDRRATPFAVLLAAFQALLARTAGQADMAVGAPASGRLDPRFRSTFGYLVRPVVLRADLSDRPSFATLTDRARDEVAAALAHQAYPFARLVERLLPRRDPTRSPLFQAMLVLYAEEEGLGSFALGRPGARLEMGELELESVALPEPRSQFDLTLAVTSAPDGGFDGALTYDAELLDDATIERLGAHLVNLLTAALDRPDLAFDALPMLDEAERHALLWEGTDGTATRGTTAAGAPAPPTVHGAVLAQALRTPERPAVLGPQGGLDYGELAARVVRLAAVLVGRGVGPEVSVGILLSRSADLVVAILAVLAAGGAYVPLDRRQPAARRDTMIADAGCVAVLTDASVELPAGVAAWDLEQLTAAAAEIAEAPLLPAVDPGQLAYVLFTSGSTGRPKGVAVTHRGVGALVEWAAGAYSAEELARVRAATPLTFDISVFELFVPLSLGGCAVLTEIPLETLEAAAAPVTLVNTVPSILAELLAAGGLPPSVVTVNLAGEALPRDLVDRLHAAGVERVVNLYGPTEDTVYSTAAEMAPRGDGAPPIGRPVAGGRCRVVDRHLEPVPRGTPGELVLSGHGLARGYRGRASATAERFVADPAPAVPGDRLYRTGDLVCWRADGQLAYLGRSDQQVKIQGVRVEPGEVEAALRALPGVREAAVMPRRGAHGTSLAAFLVAAPGVDAGTLAPASVRTALADSLPEVMLPASVVVLDELPRTASGKLDRRALPAAEGRDATPVGEYRAPNGPTARRLAALFGELTGRSRVGADDDFFSLGGHSLLAVRLVARLREERGVEVQLSEVFRAPTPQRLAAVVDALPMTAAGPPIRRRGPQAPPLLSSGQRRLWFFERVQPGTAAYNMAAAVTLEGDLDPTALAAALDALVVRHAVLRTVLVGDESPRPRLATPAEARLALPRVDLAVLPAARRPPEAVRLAAAEARRPVSLVRPPLLRAVLMRHDDDLHDLLLTAHHAVADGRSLQVFFAELVTLYRTAVDGLGDGRTLAPITLAASLPELPVSFADFAAWQSERFGNGFGDVAEQPVPEAWASGDPALESGAGGEDRGSAAAALDHWQQRLADVVPLDLPADLRRPPVRSLRGEEVELTLPEGTLARLDAVGRVVGASRFHVALAAFHVLLARWAGAEDVVVGIPVAERTHRELEGLVGFFVNTLPIRLRVDADEPFADLVGRVRDEVLAAHAHRQVPLEILAERLVGHRSLSHAPLFQVTFAEEEPLPVTCTAGLTLRPRRLGTGTAKFDLGASLLADADVAVLRLEFDRDLFLPATARRFLDALATLLAAGLEAPQTAVGELETASGAEVRRRGELPSTAEPKAARPVPLRVLDHASAHPADVAVETGGDRLSYGDLEERARAWARRLRGEGVGIDTPVGLLLPRSPGWVVAQLATHLAGGAYVAIDPEQPLERVCGMLTDAGVRWVITDSATAAAGFSGEDVRPLVMPADGSLTGSLAGSGGAETGPAATTVGADLPGARPEGVPATARAYVIFTSGSSGRPKGVAVPHAGLAALVAWHRRAHGLGRGDRVPQLAGLGFDASVWEVWSALGNGATLCLTPPAVVADPPALVAWLEAEEISAAFLPTPLAEAVLAEPVAGGLHRLDRLLTGGDRLRTRPPAGLPFSVWNHYGPTEASVVATWSRVEPRGEALPTIGSAVDHLRTFVLDHRGRPVPAGGAGELCLAGPGLARGYAGRPAETAVAFVPHPWGDGDRLYRTGDRVRLAAGGELAYLGRLDQQVQIRGFRVEPGEVEATLRRHRAVGEAAVVVRGEAAGRRLVAFVAVRHGAEPAVGGDELRRWATAELPAHLVPAEVVILASLPLNASGKLDRAALPEGTAGPGRVAPRSELEALLAELWSEALGVEEVGVHDDFFALGGHSLVVTRLAARLRDELGVDLSPQDFFTHPTVAGLSVAVAQHLMDGADEAELAAALDDVDDAEPLT